MGLRGFLFTPFAAVASAAAAELLVQAGGGNNNKVGNKRGANNNRNEANPMISIAGKGKERTVRKKVSFDNAESEVSIFDQPAEREPMSEDQQLELGKQARRQSIFALLHSQPYGHVTKPYVSSIVAMICLPDAGACKYSIQMAQKLLDLSIVDARFIVPVAKEAFSAALSVLLQQVSFTMFLMSMISLCYQILFESQEKWSIGLEWELIEYVLDVYLMLVVGEGRHPVSVGAGSGYPGSNSGGSNAAGGANSPMAGGNTGLVPIKHHTARSEWPQQVGTVVHRCFPLFLLFLPDFLFSQQTHEFIPDSTIAERCHPRETR